MNETPDVRRLEIESGIGTDQWVVLSRPYHDYTTRETRIAALQKIIRLKTRGAKISDRNKARRTRIEALETRERDLAGKMYRHQRAGIPVTMEDARDLMDLRREMVHERAAFEDDHKALIAAGRASDAECAGYRKIMAGPITSRMVELGRAARDLLGSDVDLLAQHPEMAPRELVRLKNEAAHLSNIAANLTGRNEYRCFADAAGAAVVEVIEAVSLTRQISVVA